jgi:hypothetical protein
MVDRRAGCHPRGQRGSQARREDSRRSIALDAVQRSAASLGAVLTTDEAAIRRAADSMIRLDMMINKMKRDGSLHAFNRRYAAERAAALAEGRGFMGYNIALTKLKMALITGLQSGRAVGELFAKAFRH